MFIAAGTASAQQDQGTVVGRVTDSTGAIVRDAVVTAIAATGASIHTKTNTDGHYVLTSLVIGVYQVHVEAPGFKRAISEAIRVHANARARLDIQLELGTVNESMTVRAVAPLLQTDTSSLTHTVAAEGITTLPVNGRNVSRMAALIAGVLPAFGHVQRESGFNANGQWAVQNNFTLDGVDNNSQIMGLQDRKAQVLVPNLDAVAEFQVHSSNYTAEFGRGAGAVMSLSLKSGTNVLRGTAHEFFRSDVFDARDAFDYADRTGDGKADPDALRQHQFGVTAGGPIQKNRTFYFGSLEVTSVDMAVNRLVTVPTLSERQGIFDRGIVTVVDPATGIPFPGNSIPRARWDRVAEQLVSLWPEPNFAGTTRANYAASAAQTQLRSQMDVRIDHAFSSRDRMFVRGSWMDFGAEQEGPFPAPAVGGGNNDFARDDNTAVNVALSETHVFGASIVHEVRLGVNRLRTNKRPLGRGYPNQDFGLAVETPEPIEGLSRLNLGGPLSYASLGEFQFNPNDKTAGTLQLLDNLSIAHGAHTVKFGIDFRWVRSDSVGAQFARGIFTFNGRFTGSSFADFLLGMTSSRQFSTVQRGNLRERDYMFYVQDDWRVAPRLTINLGVRYELASPRFDTSDRMSALDASAFPEVRVIRAGEGGRSWSDRALVRTDTNNWAPRLGVAFQPAPLWTARAAWGRFYGSPKGLGPAVYLLNNWPASREITTASTRTRSAGQLADGLAQVLLGSATEMPADLTWSTWSPDFSSPTISQWNVSAQRQIARSWVITTAYVGSSSRHLQRIYNVNAAGPGDSATERERRMIPSLGAIMLAESSGSASYHGLQTTVEKRWSDGTQGSLSYTWSHSIDDVTEPAGAEGIIVVQDVRNFAADRGNSGFDRRHRLVGQAAVDLPFGRDRRWLKSGGFTGALVGGWQLAAIIALQSGAYFDVTILDSANRLGVTPNSSVWRPDVVGDPRMPHQTADAWIDADAFAIPQNADGSYRYGTLGRNSLLGPGYFALDLGLTKGFRVGKGRSMQVRWEVFNATNHPSYGLPNSTLGSADFGTIRSTVSTPRQMQFGAKFLF